MQQVSRTLLQNSELLRHLDSGGLDRVARLAVRRSYKQGATIFADGESPDAVYGVISGQVQISARTASHDEILLKLHGPGSVIGLPSCIDGLPRCGTARAASSLEAFGIFRADLLRLIAADPLVSLGVLGVFCNTCRVTTRVIIGEYAQRDVRARLAHRVLELTGADASNGSFPGDSLDISQAELAKLVFVSRQVVNLHLSEWQSRGWISTSHRRLRVTDRQALLAVAGTAHAGA